jgi:hypothetical protein
MIPPLPFGTLALSLLDDVHIGEALSLSSKGGEGDWSLDILARG